jgi:hypothetical protein
MRNRVSKGTYLSRALQGERLRNVPYLRGLYSAIGRYGRWNKCYLGGITVLWYDASRTAIRPPSHSQQDRFVGLGNISGTRWFSEVGLIANGSDSGIDAIFGVRGRHMPYWSLSGRAFHSDLKIRHARHRTLTDTIQISLLGLYVALILNEYQPRNMLQSNVLHSVLPYPNILSCNVSNVQSCRLSSTFNLNGWVLPACTYRVFGPSSSVAFEVVATSLRDSGPYFQDPV